MKQENINDKKIISSSEMIGELIKNIIIFGLIFFLIYRFVYAFATTIFRNYDNLILLAFVVIILQTIMISLTLHIANKKSFKNSTIYQEDVPKVIKTISFIIIVVLLLQVFATFSSVNSAIDEAINKNYKLQYQEHIYSIIYDDAQMSNYRNQRTKAIEEVKIQMYKYLSVVEIGICIVYVSALLIERKTLYNKAIEKAVV